MPEGTLRKRPLIRDHVQDAMVYSLVAEDLDGKCAAAEVEDAAHG
jgi:hypothetical protein